jgi:T5SS/PEP-CTERM-associated repeat protein
MRTEHPPQPILGSVCAIVTLLAFSAAAWGQTSDPTGNYDGQWTRNDSGDCDISCRPDPGKEVESGDCRMRIVFASSLSDLSPVLAELKANFLQPQPGFVADHFYAVWAFDRNPDGVLDDAEQRNNGFVTPLTEEGGQYIGDSFWDQLNFNISIDAEGKLTGIWREYVCADPCCGAFCDGVEESRGDLQFDLERPGGGPCDPVNWMETNSGGFDDPNNWETGVAPDVDQIAAFNGADVFSVSIGEDTTIDGIAVTASQPEINLGGFTLTLSGNCQGESLKVSEDQAETPDASLRFDNGTVDADSIVVGELAEDAGVLSVFTDALLTDDSVTVIGEKGIGFLIVTEGGDFEGFDVTLGLNTGSEGTASAQSSSGESELTIDPGGSLTVGFSGQGNLTIGANSTLDNRGDLILAHESSGSATVQFQSSGSGDILADTVVGRSGQATLSVTGGARVNSKGPASIGSLAGSDGDVSVNDGFWGTLNTLKIGDAGDGDLNIGSGGLVASASATLGVQSTGKGAVAITGDGGWEVDGVVRVGAAGAGVVSVETESTLKASLVGVTANGQIGATTIYIGAGSSAAKVSARFQETEIPTTGVIADVVELEEGATLTAGTLTLADGGALTGGGRIEGDVIMTGGVLEIQFAGPESDQQDALSVTGSASITGGVIRFKSANGYVPQASDTAMFLNAEGGTTIENASFEFEGVAEGFEFQVTASDGHLSFEALNDAEPGEGTVSGDGQTVDDGSDSAGDTPTSAMPCAPGFGCGPTTLGTLPMMIVVLMFMKRTRRNAPLRRFE